MLDNTPVLGRDSSLAQSQNRVLRNTYALLGLTMIPTVIGAFIGMGINFSFMYLHPFMSFIGFMAITMGFQAMIVANRNNGLGIGLLFVFTFLLGIFLGSLLQNAMHFSNGAQLVGLAAGGTALILLTMAGIATTSKRDFTGMGKFLAIGFIVVIVAVIANIFLHIPALSLAISGVIVMISSGFLLYEINSIVRGGETNYVMATMSIYMSLFNIFSNLLSILMSVMGNRN